MMKGRFCHPSVMITLEIPYNWLLRCFNFPFTSGRFDKKLKKAFNGYR